MSEIFFGAYCDVETCCLSWHKLKSYFGYIGTPYWTAFAILAMFGNEVHAVRDVCYPATVVLAVHGHI